VSNSEVGVLASCGLWTFRHFDVSPGVNFS